jgi:predicted PurR-regulated permease PerM
MAQNQQSQPVWIWSSRNVLLATLFVVFVGLGFWLLYRFRTVLLIFFIAILIGTGIKPAVIWMHRRLSIPRIQGQVIVFAAIFAAILAFALLMLPLVLEQSTQVTGQLSTYYERAYRWLVLSPSQILRDLGLRLSPQLEMENLVQEPVPEGETDAEENENTVDMVTRTFRYVGIAARTLFTLIALFLMSFYWTLDGDRAIRTALLLVPVSQRENAREIIDAVEGKLGGFLLGQSILCVIIGALSLVAYLLIGLPNALVLAIIAGVLEAVPTVGPVLGAIPALLVALSTDPTKVILVLIATGIIQLLENNLLVPRVMDRSVGVHPLLTLLFLAALSSLLGLLGAMLAIPVAAIVQLLINRFLINPMKATEPRPEGRDIISLLRMRAQEIAQDSRKRVDQKPVDGNAQAEQEQDGGIEETIETLASDLDRILAQIPTAENQSA